MTDEPSPGVNPLAPWPTLAERDAGEMPEPELYEGVPPHLDRPLREWVDSMAGSSELVQRVLTRCRVSWADTLPVHSGGGQVGYTRDPKPRDVLVRLAAGELDGIMTARPLDRLSVIDAMVHLHPHWDTGNERSFKTSYLDRLDRLLRDSGSAWEVNLEFRGLYRRVDPTATEAWQATRKQAEDAGRVMASQYLGEAWRKIYGLHPEPSAGYAAAVKAVENAALAVVFPGDTKKTVHMVRDELQKKAAQWRFTLVDDVSKAAGEGSIDVVAQMLDRLLRGETDRHAQQGVNRPSTQEEAEAAVHLAVTLVQWFLSGAIQPTGAQS